ncbi:DUF3874 domain-containing protein [Bacteroides sp. KH365_2]|uniref:DUF3874 domain-containing protein n=1 Tax=Bacteroides muris (ex Fokt et al. 2023) TaxID=2937417 RepID=A0A9X2NRJ4_9BACE|nr:DUF3874 domain-containing protein [Bacteroides muris (ex Fokt et al. 2023)]
MNDRSQPIERPGSFTYEEPCKGTENKGLRSINKYVCRQQAHNEAFYRVSLVEEAVRSLFRTPLPAEKSFDLTAADIFDELQKTHPALMRGSNPVQFGSVLLRAGLKRRHTKYGNVYEVVRRKKEVPPERVER